MDWKNYFTNVLKGLIGAIAVTVIIDGNFFFVYDICRN